MQRQRRWRSASLSVSVLLGSLVTLLPATGRAHAQTTPPPLHPAGEGDLLLDAMPWSVHTHYVRAGAGIAVSLGGELNDANGFLDAEVPGFGFSSTDWDLLSEGDLTFSFAAGLRLLDTHVPMAIEIEYRRLNDEFEEIERRFFGGFLFTRESIDAELEAQMVMVNLLFEIPLPNLNFDTRWILGGGIGWIETDFHVTRIAGADVSGVVPGSHDSGFGGQIIAGIVTPLNDRLEVYADMRAIFGIDYDTTGFSGDDLTITFEAGLRLTF